MFKKISLSVAAFIAWLVSLAAVSHYFAKPGVALVAALEPSFVSTLIGITAVLGWFGIILGIGALFGCALVYLWSDK